MLSIVTRVGVASPLSLASAWALCSLLASGSGAVSDWVGPARLAAQVPADEDWRTLETARFHVHFPAALEAVARRAAGAAERAYDRLAPEFDATVHPVSPIDLVVTDHVDASNGYATVSPHRRVVVYAAPPVDGMALSFYDDWLDLVVTHELAHVFHLDATGPLGRALRSVFGRIPVWPVFPHQGEPRWLKEGLATHYESAFSKAGRARGTYTEMQIRTAALEGALESIDRASGVSAAWPGGQRPYTYGTEFVDWLIDRHGAGRVAAFVKALAEDWIPFRLDAAARKAFGSSFSEEWSDWVAERKESAGMLARALGARAPLARTDTVTRGARVALYPRLSADGRLGYAAVDGIRVSTEDGSGARRFVATNAVSTFAWLAGGGVVFSQVGEPGTDRSYKDLYVATSDGEIRRVTSGARLDQPSPSPAGRRAAAIRGGGGTTELVWVDLETGKVSPIVPTAPDVHWAFPAVSPDGRWVAASRWRDGAWDVVVVDPGGAIVSVARDRALDLAPSWSPDGRSLVWMSDRTGIWNLMGTGFNQRVGNVGPVRQVTNLLTGAAFPSVDPTGRWIYMSVYHSDGWDVERIPFAPERWQEPFPVDARFAAPAGPAAPAVDSSASPTRPYRATRSLTPGFWLPIVDVGERLYLPGRDDVWLLRPGVGFVTLGQDVVGRHRISLAATLSASGARVEGGLTYRYAGLGNPVLSARADQVWDGRGPLLGRVDSVTVDTLFIRERERRFTLGAEVRLRRNRGIGRFAVHSSLVENRQGLLDSDLRASTRFSLPSPTSRLGELRALASFSTARAGPLSISTEEGVGLSVQGRVRRELSLADSLVDRLGVDRSLDDLVLSARFFVPLRGLGFERHVLGVRATGGAARGPGADRFHFDLGGSGRLTNPLLGIGTFLLGFPVRGYDRGERRGRYAWSATTEWRFPIAQVSRGVGLAPIFLDRVSGDLFLDAGDAWGPELGADAPRFHNPRRGTLLAVGAEVAVDLFLFFTNPAPLRIGVAMPLVRGVRRRAPGFYVRFGASF